MLTEQFRRRYYHETHDNAYICMLREAVLHLSLSLYGEKLLRHRLTQVAPNAYHLVRICSLNSSHSDNQGKNGCDWNRLWEPILYSYSCERENEQPNYDNK